MKNNNNLVDVFASLVTSGYACPHIFPLNHRSNTIDNIGTLYLSNLCVCIESYIAIVQSSPSFLHEYKSQSRLIGVAPSCIKNDQPTYMRIASSSSWAYLSPRPSLTDVGAGVCMTPEC